MWARAAPCPLPASTTASAPRWCLSAHTCIFLTHSPQEANKTNSVHSADVSVSAGTGPVWLRPQLPSALKCILNLFFSSGWAYTRCLTGNKCLNCVQWDISKSFNSNVGACPNLNSDAILKQNVTHINIVAHLIIKKSSMQCDCGWFFSAQNLYV